MTAVVHPLGIIVLRAYLLTRSTITGSVGTRLGATMPPADAAPRWPAIRLTELTTVEMVPRRFSRMNFQAECWATTQIAADQLARTVVAELRESDNWMHSSAVLAGVENLAISPRPDETVNPPQPRSVITGHLHLRPNT